MLRKFIPTKQDKEWLDLTWDSICDYGLLETDIGRVVTLNNGYKVPLDQPFADDDLSEAEYQGKDVKLNYPMRGGTKKYHVYVKNPSTGKIKKLYTFIAYS